MESITERLRASVSLKITVIGILILVLLIPVAMIRGVVEDRVTVNRVAAADIMRGWGDTQVVAGPILVVPGTVVREGINDRRTVGTRLNVLPETLVIDAALETELRARGIHEIPVYRSTIRISGTFHLPADIAAQHRVDNLDWDAGFIALAVSDARAIPIAPRIRVGDRDLGFEPGGQRLNGLPPQIVASLENANGEALAGRDVPFEMELSLNGAESLQFLPLGGSTRVDVRSPWTSPSFSGNQLPQAHEIGEDGFTARWEVSQFARPLPSSWLDGDVQIAPSMQSAFGVDLFTGVGLYQQTLRATKYAVLFIGLTFVAWFLFETMGRLSLHPLQYLLIGFANALFYLLLLSFAEQIGFGPAYALSTVASAGLVVGYSRAVLGGIRPAGMMAALLGALYGFLYLVLKSEDFAMLAGAAGLWVILGTIMYLTRHVDWYRPRGA